MSGVEVAGLVLGAFPLLLHALDKWRAGAQRVENWWQIRREYRKCTHEIEYQQLRYERSLEECLLPLVADDTQLRALIDDAGGNSWKEPQLETKLKRRLSERAYRSYLGTIEDMKEAMVELQERAIRIEFQDLLDQANPPQSRIPVRSTTLAKGKSKIIFEAKRVGYTFDKPSRTRLLKEMDDCNQRLQELLSISDRVNALRESSNHNAVQSQVNKTLLQFWRHANSIFDLIASAWTCSGKEKHLTNILLEHRMSTEVKLRVRFLSGHDIMPPTCGKWNWQEAEVKILKDTPISQLKQIFPPSQSTPQRTSVIVSCPATSTRNVRPRQIPARQPPAMRVTPSTTNPKVVSFPIHPNSSPITLIDDLCTTIATCKETCFGGLQGDDCQYAVSPIIGPNPIQHTQCWKSISLKELLSQDQPEFLDRRQRYSVALTLASSHLQLHSSQWLGDRWSKSDITFPLDNNSKPLTNQAYLCRKVDEYKALPNPTDRTFSTLGILLLELCFGVAFEDTIEWKQSIPANGPNAFSDLGAAFAWSERVLGEAGPEYAEAVTWCLGRMSSPTRDANWRKELLERVVMPLEQCYKALL